MWVTLVKTDTSYFFRRNRDLGTISVYVGYRDVRCLPPLYVHICKNIFFPLINTPPPQRGDNHPTDFSVSGVIFDGDQDFEGLRSPRAHLDTVLRNLSRHLGHPRISL